MGARGMGVVAVLAALLPGVGWADSGVFRTAVVATVGSGPAALGVGDFDNDGALDVVIANGGAGGNGLVVAIGFNDGTLTGFRELPLASLPSSLVVGLFDGDEDEDVVIAKSDEDGVAFLKGLGTRACVPQGEGLDCRRFFGFPGPVIEVGVQPMGLAVGHFDPDGELDIAVANRGVGETSPGSVSVLRGGGDGTFTRVDQDPADEAISDLPAGAGTQRVAVGDVNGDGSEDILALNTMANSVSVYFGRGDGTFSVGPVQSIGMGPQALALAYLDGDEALDLLTANSNEDAVAVMLGNDDGTFQEPRLYAVGTAPNGVLVHHIDGDSHLDVVVSNSFSHDVSLLRGVGDGTLRPARTFVADAEPRALGVGDFDADGRDDVVAVSIGSGSGATAAILRTRPEGILHGVEDLLAEGVPTGLAVGDIDGDAIADLVAGSDNGKVLLFRSLGEDGFRPSEALSVGGQPKSVAVADLNGDLRLDIVAADMEGHRAVVLLGEGGGTFGAAQSYATAEEPAAITTGDFNGDGRPDLAVAAIEAEQASVLLQQADGTFGPAQNTTVEETPTDIKPIDADCDGLDDLVVANFAAGTVSVLRSEGDGTFSLAQTLPTSSVGELPAAIAVADFNSDGTPDFAVSNALSIGGQRSVRFFYGECDGTYEPGASSKNLPAGPLVVAIVARDFTGDGIVDVAAVSETGNSARVFIGNGSDGAGNGTFSARPADAVSRMPEALAAADFNDDGRYDAATANTAAVSSNISILLNCARDDNCDPFAFPPPGAAALRGDANDDGVRSAGDLVAVVAEVMDGDGQQVEDIGMAGFEAAPGVDANGDGRVDGQDARAVARRIFSGA